MPNETRERAREECTKRREVNLEGAAEDCHKRTN